MAIATRPTSLFGCSGELVASSCNELAQMQTSAQIKYIGTGSGFYPQPRQTKRE
ncbi:hypothetical protein [Campylobacter showae]|uniref:Uncharacterized protein n=1 Tax=Campylobacter showae RM3277 TaxID=553219 RepID=C6RJ81_9BACT|nr:hypothetical protein [Campylobacter showae]EET78662.1 hypothetical protein CAMSH0001_0183 [Campylobacter showae RM3277]